MMKIKEKINIDEIIDIIVNQYGPVEKIFLFGSHARGDKRKIIFLLIFLIAFFLFAKVSSAATYYISPSGNDINPGTETLPWATFAKAWTVLQAGDILIAKDGIYHEAIKPTISGTIGKPILIKAQNDGQAVIDGQNNRIGIEIDSKKYLTIEGFLSINPGEASAIVISAPDGDFTAASNIILRRVGARGGSNLDNSGAAIEIARARDSLLEDVWAYGFGRYGMSIYGSTNITVRRAVIRWDRWDGTAYKPCDPKFNLGVYNTHDSLFENILLIDGGKANCGDHGALYVPGNDNGNTAPYVDSSNNRFFGIISYNNKGTSFQVEANGGSNNFFKDVVGWKNDFGISVNRSVGTIFDHITLGRNATDGSWTSETGLTIIKNSLIYNHPGRGLNGNLVSDYNNVFGNNPDYYYVAVGSHDISQNPNLVYITRLEAGTPGKGTASDSGDRGGTVVNRYIAGSLTTTPLWPWPYEDRIRQDMCDANFLAVVGRTGINDSAWCTSGKTLTRYIWEAAGNTIPSEIYGVVFDTSPPAAPTGLTIN